MRRPAVLLLILLVSACGPTANVVTTPVPGTDAPTTGPTAAPTAAATPGPILGPTSGATEPTTPITLTTPSAGVQSPGPSPGPTAPPRFQVLSAFPTAGAYEVTDVIATADGFVAVGFGGLDGAPYFGVRQGIVWRSADGLTWTQTIDPTLARVTPFRVVSMGADLFLFGVLSNCQQIFDETCTELEGAGNAVWRSTPAGTWEQLPQPPDVQLGLIDDVVVANGRMAIFGSAADENQTTTIWLGSDGLTWTPTTDLAGLDPISSMAAGPGGLVAFGTRLVPELEDIVLTAAWSADGAHFTPAAVPQLAGTAIDDVVAGAAGYAGVGYRTSEGIEISAVTLQSRDGTSWAEGTNSDGTMAASGLVEVHPLDLGFVAFGFTAHFDDFTVQDGAAWITSDGADWRLLGPLAGTFSQFSASAMGASGVVAFAVEHTDVDEENLASTIHGWFAPPAALTTV